MYDLSKENINRLREMTRRMRLLGLDMALSTGNGGSHLGGSFSCMEMLAVLYGEVLRLFPEENQIESSGNDEVGNGCAGNDKAGNDIAGNDETEICRVLADDRDIFIPSKNHCVLAHIPALAEAGIISKEECLEFQKNGGRLTGYPLRPEIGLEYSGGSLGMAISVIIGMALAEKEREKRIIEAADNEFIAWKDRRKFYVLMGDAELNEGSIWEAFMSAAHFKLDNVIAIIDRNHLSYDGDTEDVMALGDLAGKLRSFGWYVSECNGRDVGDVLRAFDERYKGNNNFNNTDNNNENDHELISEASGKPQVIIVDTIKGMGVSFMEGRPEFHHRRLSQAEYEKAREEIIKG